MKLLFVCTGNMCRSPMIKFMTDNYAESRNISLETDSAGLIDHYKDMSPETEKVLTENNIPHSRNISKPLNRELLDWADYVFVMSEEHKKVIEKAFGKSEKLLEISLFYGKDVPDPYGKGMEAYRETYKIFESVVSKIVRYVLGK